MSGLTKIKKLEELIKGKIDGEIVEQTLDTLVPPGENFGSVIYKVDFKVRNGEKLDVYHAVAKCTPPNKVTQELFNIQVTVKAEISWYTTIIPTIRNFQRDHGVEQEADFFQTFYGARISLDPNSDIVDLDAVILTENLKPLGYKNEDRHIGFDLKTSKAILKNLATLHAVPIAIKLQNKDLFDKNIKPHLPGLQLKEDSSMKGKDIFQPLKEALKEVPEIAPYINRIAASLDKNSSRNNQRSQRIIDEPWGSICHNDFWINNIMVKDGNDPQAVFLDFQMCSYETTSNDVLFFLLVSVAQDVINEHMNELIKYYWDEFLKNLQYLDIDNSSFTYEEFLKQIDKVAASSIFGLALFRTYIILADKGHSDFDSSDKNFKKDDLDKLFKFTLNTRHIQKYKWLVLEFVKRGWI